MELTAKFTVYFEDPFWVGVYERSQDGKLEAARVVFGAEPKDTARPGIGTKAQQALKLQQEQGKLERRAARKQRSEEEKRRQFELRQQKKKEKHRGR